MSAHSIHAALDPIVVQFDCEGCQNSFRNRLQDLIVRWMAVSVSPRYFFLSAPLRPDSFPGSSNSTLGVTFMERPEIEVSGLLTC